MNHTTHKWLAYGCLALSMALVGVYVALSKPLAAALPVFLLAWMRFGIAAVAMLPWLKAPANEAPLTPASKRLLFFESFFGNFLFSICMLYGVSMTTAVSSGVILSTIPAAIALLSWVLLGEKFTRRTLVAIGFAALGIGLLALSKPSAGNTSGHQSSYWWGNLLVLGAVACEAVYVVVGKKLTGRLGPKRISAIINLWGLALMTPAGLYVALQFDFASVAWQAYALLVFYALAASVVTVWLWMTGLETIPASNAGVFSVLLPVSATLTGILFLGETLSLLQGAALVVGLIGIVLATLPPR